MPSTDVTFATPLGMAGWASAGAAIEDEAYGDQAIQSATFNSSRKKGDGFLGTVPFSFGAAAAAS